MTTAVSDIRIRFSHAKINLFPVISQQNPAANKQQKIIAGVFKKGKKV